jgi:hypothetical protein
VLFFMDDIYGHDRTLDAALQSGYPYPAKGEAARGAPPPKQAAP